MKLTKQILRLAAQHAAKARWRGKSADERKAATAKARRARIRKAKQRRALQLAKNNA